MKALLIALCLCLSAFQVRAADLLVFTATWCRQCQADKPALKHLENRGIEIVTIDADDSPELCEQYHVDRVPTYIVDGQRTHSILDVQRWLNSFSDHESLR